MSTIREVTESPLAQGIDEEIAYRFNWTAIGTPTSPTVKLYDVTLEVYTDVSSTKLVGSPSVAGDYVTTPVVKTLESGKRYRLECKVTVNGNLLEAYCFIVGEK